MLPALSLLQSLPLIPSAQNRLPPVLGAVRRFVFRIPQLCLALGLFFGSGCGVHQNSESPDQLGPRHTPVAPLALERILQGLGFLVLDEGDACTCSCRCHPFPWLPAPTAQRNGECRPWQRLDCRDPGETVVAPRDASRTALANLTVAVNMLAGCASVRSCGRGHTIPCSAAPMS
jgi:hypothetical protein